MVSEFFTSDFFKLSYVFCNFSFNLIIDFSTIFVVLSTSFCSNSESLRNWQTDVCHFCKVSTFTTKKFSHICITFTKKVYILFSFRTVSKKSHI